MAFYDSSFGTWQDPSRHQSGLFSRFPDAESAGSNTVENRGGTTTVAFPPTTATEQQRVRLNSDLLLRQPFATSLDDEGDSYTLYIYQPNMRKKDLSLSVSGDILYVTGTRQLRGVSYEFKRELSLPRDADIHKIDANYQTGRVMITIPKISDKVHRSIPITGIKKQPPQVETKEKEQKESTPTKPTPSPRRSIPIQTSSAESLSASSGSASASAPSASASGGVGTGSGSGAGSGSGTGSGTGTGTEFGGDPDTSTSTSAKTMRLGGATVVDTGVKAGKEVGKDLAGGWEAPEQPKYQIGQEQQQQQQQTTPVPSSESAEPIPLRSDVSMTGHDVATSEQRLREEQRTHGLEHDIQQQKPHVHTPQQQQQQQQQQEQAQREEAEIGSGASDTTTPAAAMAAVKDTVSSMTERMKSVLGMKDKEEEQKDVGKGTQEEEKQTPQQQPTSRVQPT